MLALKYTNPLNSVDLVWVSKIKIIIRYSNKQHIILVRPLMLKCAKSPKVEALLFFELLLHGVTTLTLKGSVTEFSACFKQAENDVLVLQSRNCLLHCIVQKERHSMVLSMNSFGLFKVTNECTKVNPRVFIFWVFLSLFLFHRYYFYTNPVESSWIKHWDCSLN